MQTDFNLRYGAYINLHYLRNYSAEVLLIAEIIKHDAFGNTTRRQELLEIMIFWRLVYLIDTINRGVKARHYMYMHIDKLYEKQLTSGSAIGQNSNPTLTLYTYKVRKEMNILVI